MTVYDVLCSVSKEHKKIKGGGYTDVLIFDLKEKSIRSKGLYIVKNGRLVVNQIDVEGEVYILDGLPLGTENTSLEMLQPLYDSYLYSRPGSYYVHSPFLAKTSDELTYEQLLKGIPRNHARCCLEAAIVLGNFNWPNVEHYYWKGKNGFVLFREWILKEDYNENGR